MVAFSQKLCDFINLFFIEKLSKFSFLFKVTMTTTLKNIEKRTISLVQVDEVTSQIFFLSFQ